MSDLSQLWTASQFFLCLLDDLPLPIFQVDICVLRYAVCVNTGYDPVVRGLDTLLCPPSTSAPVDECQSDDASQFLCIQIETRDQEDKWMEVVTRHYMQQQEREDADQLSM